MRPEINLIIPVQKDSEQLSKTVTTIEKYTTNYSLTIVKEPNLNVSEARQKAMDEGKNNLICFLDDDSEMIHQGWLDAMYSTLQQGPAIGAVFGGEWWGSEPQVQLTKTTDPEVAYGPAACMLMDKSRLPTDLKWDNNIGLRSGWLGGDFEEVDYCYRLARSGLHLLRSTGALFHHTGGRKTLNDFSKTDRQKTVSAMTILLNYKYAKAPNDDDWFKGLQYVKADPNDDTMLAPGSSLRDCYKDVIKRNGLSYVKGFNRMGLV